MDLTNIAMTREEARNEFEAYQSALRYKSNEEYKALMQGYKALSKGHVLIDLQTAFDEAGTDDKDRPNLAIAQVNAKRVHVSLFAGSCHFKWKITSTNSWGDNYSNAKGNVIKIGLPKNNQRRNMNDFNDLVTPVPLTPPKFLPNRVTNKHFVLWEVEEWEEIPSDPALLKHIGGDLYALLATWDLTPLEKAVLSKTRSIN